jgi:hypothetical protein
MTKKKGWRQLLRTGAMAAAMVGTTAVSAVGCLDRPIEPVEPRTTSTIIERLTQSAVDKIDLLLVIDNSRSMADKQEILKLAVPDLAQQLVNPLCVDDDGVALPADQQPTDPLADCPPATEREFDPIVDIHIGVITSSLGGHGADSCSGASSPTENDRGYLITRGGSGENVSTYQNLGFLVWDPDGTDPSHDPQGETSIETLNTNVQELVGGAGEEGCGYEAILESWYRFLVDPDPYADVALESDTAVLQGTDNDLLKMRKDFLRPDSLLAIIMLADENDCSIRDGGQFYFAGQIYQPGTNNPYHLPPARAACASDPNSKCCRSCGQDPGDGCDAGADMCDDSLSALQDNINLRCWDQKRRFGIDFLWPTDRYTTALSSPQVTDRFGNVVSNPLFIDLNPDDDNNAVRDPGLVFIAGIIGVPWQDIARKNENGQPDLLAGLNQEGEAVGGFQSGAELAVNGTYDVILGDPTCYHESGCLPTDPLMIESVAARTGANPVTGEALVTSSDPLGNSINGHEYDIPQRDDLQYACVFDLVDATSLMPIQRDCTGQQNCDCNDPDNDNPLCYQGGFGQTQYKAKAYPGIRELSVLKSVGTQGIVGSICPAQQNDPTSLNFGYRPAVGAIVERLKQALGGQCLPRSLTPNAEGQVPCIILEARVVSGQDCNALCDSTNGRRSVDQNSPAVVAAKEDPITKDPAGNPIYNCYCEINQLAGEELDACQTDESDNPVTSGGDPVHGWCYVDASTAPPVGNPDIVAKCPENEKRIIRFVGEGEGAAGATLFITCTGE